MHRADAEFFSTAVAKSYFSLLGLPESPPADILVEDGEGIKIGTEELEVLHTPGHTPGSICLYSSPHCFTGDTLFVGGVGRTDFPGGSSNELSLSINKRLLTLPPDTIIWPGHGYGGSQSTITQERRTNPYL
jgi:glyoxylase-like metal-dependent hydrolase (beta-lactamase superfamily II)